MSEDITGGPYVVAALFCEKALRESDGVMSLIRIVDRWQISGNTDQMQMSVVQTTLVIIFKSGMHRGSSSVVVKPITPSKNRLPVMTFPVLFEGDDDRGVGVVAAMGFPVSEEGVYWFEIEVEGQLMTRTPFRVVYHKAIQPSP
jgi:hypothetical protein